MITNGPHFIANCPHLITYCPLLITYCHNRLLYVVVLKVSLVDDSQFTITISSESGPLSFIHTDSETIVAALNHIKHRYHLTQPESYTPHTKIKPKDVPGTLLNVVRVELILCIWRCFVIKGILYIHAYTSAYCITREIHALWNLLTKFLAIF